MRIRGHDIGVCSAALEPTGAVDLINQVRKLGFEHVQLELTDLVGSDAARRALEIGHLRDSGLKFTGGRILLGGADRSSPAAQQATTGIYPDATWPERRDRIVAAGEIARELGLKALSVEPGHIPASNDPKYEVMVGRVRELAKALTAVKLHLLLGTGPEPVHVLLQFLNDAGVKSLGVDFAPADMVIYGTGDPAEAVGVLGRHIKHVRLRDAQSSLHPGLRWGVEVPMGRGELDVPALLHALHGVGFTGPLCLESTAPKDRAGDLVVALGWLSQWAD
jgi:sugar phosphate isomerase/epimerase